MLSYVAPPIVAAFLMGIFTRRTNGNGAFIGLMSGLLIAIIMLFAKNALFGGLHFLFIVPILLVITMLIMWVASRFGMCPEESKLETTTYSLNDFKKEISTLRIGNLWSNYLWWAIMLVMLCIAILIIFS